MKMIKQHKYLFLILLISIVLRFYNLSGNRPHLTNDEAALGYNAYSILKTARDEHAEFLPVVFKSFGDWKPGLYVYATVPFVAVFGLSEFAVRLPSAVAGVLAVFLVYRLVLFFYKRKDIALFSAFFLAISPWHIQFSRGAWEANLALTLLLAAVYLFLYSFKNNSKTFILSALFFALTLWTYQSAKLASFLVLLGLFLFYKQEVFRLPKKTLFLGALLGIVVSLPVLVSIFSGKGGRLEVMSVFSYTRPEEYIEDTILSQDNIDTQSPVFTLFHPEYFNLARGVFGRYFNHFSGRFLFFEGDWANPRHTSPNIGYLLLLDLPLLLAGMYYLAKKTQTQESKFILYWLAVSPLPSALSRDSVHGVRALNMIIPLVVILGLGASGLLSRAKKSITLKSVLLVLGIVYIYNFYFYLDAYHTHAPKVDYADYLYGYKQVVEKISPMQKTHEKIVFKQSFDQPYIYFLFFQKYDPAVYQDFDNYEEGKFGDVGKIKALDNIEFRSINWSGDKQMQGILLVGPEIDFPLHEIENNPDYKFERVYNPDGSTAFIILEVL